MEPTNTYSRDVLSPVNQFGRALDVQKIGDAIRFGVRRRSETSAEIVERCECVAEALLVVGRMLGECQRCKD